MADINVKQLSKAIKIDLEELLAQMKAAGLPHKSDKDVVSAEDKKVLLKYIKDSKKDNKKTISLNKTSSKTSKPNLSVTRIPISFLSRYSCKSLLYNSPFLFFSNASSIDLVLIPAETPDSKTTFGFKYLTM